MRKEIIEAILDYIELHGLGARAGAAITTQYDEDHPAKIDSKGVHDSIQQADGTFYARVSMGSIGTGTMQ